MDISLHEVFVEQVAPYCVHQFTLAVSENWSGGRFAKLLSVGVLYGIYKLVRIRPRNYEK
jgi:hypothetical protein